MEQAAQQSGYFGGQFLIAMPTMPDPRFERSVIYLLSHSAQSAMGIVVNKPLPNISFKELAGQLGIEKIKRKSSMPVHFGGRAAPHAGSITGHWPRTRAMPQSISPAK